MNKELPIYRWVEEVNPKTLDRIVGFLAVSLLMAMIHMAFNPPEHREILVIDGTTAPILSPRPEDRPEP